MNENFMRHDDYVSMLKGLNAYEAAGINLYLGGDSHSARDIAYACATREEGAYMCDFIPDRTGALREIRFDCVAEEKARKRKKPSRKKAV